MIEIGLPSELTIEAINPHCLNVKWKKATGPVMGYRVYCFPGDSSKVEIIKDISKEIEESAVISGLKPETEYRVGITSVSLRTESKLVFSEHKIKLRKSQKNPCIL